MDRLRLVARREITERLRSRAFQISTLIAVLITAAAIVLPTLAANPLQSTVRIGLVDTTEEAVKSSLSSLSLTGFDVRIDYRDYDARDALDEALVEEDVHLGVIGEQQILLKEPLDRDDTSPKIRIAQLLSIVPAVTQNPVPISSVLPEPEHERGSAIAAFFGSILLYTFVLMYGNMILSGVAEEKGSRVIEVLLSAVTPRQLLYGKVFGIGAVALLQGVIVLATVLVAQRATGSDTLQSAVAGQSFQIFGWFMLAYAFYAFTYAAAGATVSRQEEAQSLSFPLTLPILIAYVASSSALGGEDSRLLAVLSFLPPTAPIAMPMRYALGFATTTHVLIAIAVTLAGIAVVARLSGIIYERSILRMGARVKLREVFR